jgi:hypothetical protein
LIFKRSWYHLVVVTDVDTRNVETRDHVEISGVGRLLWASAGTSDSTKENWSHTVVNKQCWHHHASITMLGFNKMLVEIPDETKQGRCYQRLLKTPAMAQTRSRVCLCVQCLLTSLSTHARVMH